MPSKPVEGLEAHFIDQRHHGTTPPARINVSFTVLAWPHPLKTGRAANR
jgi:hypothetical protein